MKLIYSLTRLFSEIFDLTKVLQKKKKKENRGKNSVKLTFSLKNYNGNQFNENCLQWGKFTKLPRCDTVHIDSLFFVKLSCSEKCHVIVS